MSEAELFSSQAKRHVATRFGSIALADRGEGPATLFIHGLGQSSFFWRRQLAAHANSRRCIAVDLMAHGHSEANENQDVSFRSQAAMIWSALDALEVGQVDLVLNDSGGAIGQIMAVTAPERVRSMALSNCDVYDNWPPAALSDMRNAARDGAFAEGLHAFIESPEAFRQTFGPLVYENPAFASDEAVRVNVEPIISSAERKAAFNRYVGLQDTQQLIEIDEDLRRLRIPTQIVWGTNDVFFPLKWAYYLHGALSAAKEVIELEGAKLFFPEERAEQYNDLLSTFWRNQSS